MRFYADGHLHFYPRHHAATWIRFLVTHLKRAAEGAGAPTVLGAFLVDGGSSRQWAMLGEGRIEWGGAQPNVEAQAADGAVRLRLAGAATLFLFPARQLVTAERVELLAWFVDRTLPDGLPAAEAVRRIASAGGWPVLAWAPGKWMFERSRVVWGLLEQFGPEQLLLGDSSLRPQFSPMPPAMRWGLRHGFRLAAGSDPLPAYGEERFAGAYGFSLETGFDPERPAASVRAALQQGRPLARFGRRRSWLQVARSLLRHAAEKK